MLASAFVLAACSDSTSVRPPEAVSVSLVGLPDTIAAGDIAVFQVRVLDAAGNEVPRAAVSLTSSDPAVALVDGAGRVRAVAAGRATIRASVSGAAGTADLVITAGPAVLTLRQFAGGNVPLFIETDTVFFSNGVVEPREFYLDSGSLTLSGGAHPGYQTALHFAFYAVTYDDAGQRHLVLRDTHIQRDGGSVSYDARGDLTLTSNMPSLSESASAETGGFRLLFRFSASDTTPKETFFARQAR